MANQFVIGAGTRYKKYIGADYCLKCGMWGYKEIVRTLLGDRELISFIHCDYIGHFKYNWKRCYCGIV